MNLDRFSQTMYLTKSGLYLPRLQVLTIGLPARLLLGALGQGLPMLPFLWDGRLFFSPRQDDDPPRQGPQQPPPEGQPTPDSGTEDGGHGYCAPKDITFVEDPSQPLSPDPNEQKRWADEFGIRTLGVVRPDGGLAYAFRVIFTVTKGSNIRLCQFEQWKATYVVRKNANNLWQGVMRTGRPGIRVIDGQALNADEFPPRGEDADIAPPKTQNPYPPDADFARDYELDTIVFRGGEVWPSVADGGVDPTRGPEEVSWPDAPGTVGRTFFNSPFRFHYDFVFYLRGTTFEARREASVDVTWDGKTESAGPLRPRPYSIRRRDRPQ